MLFLLKPLKFHYGYIILITGILTVLGALGFARFGYTTILPSMKASLDLNNAQMGQIATANLIGYMTFSVIGGVLATKYGARLIIMVSMLFTGATMLLTGLANSMVWALLARFLTGLGSAGANISMMGLLAAWFAPSRRGMASGLLVGGSGIALLITGVLVPKVIGLFPAYGWRLSWFIIGLCAAGIGLLCWLLLRNNPAEMTLAPIGGCPDNQQTAARPQNTDAYSLNTLYKTSLLWHLGIIYFLFGFSYIIYSTFFSTAVVSDKNFTQAQAGLIWSLIGLLSMFSGVLWGTISDYFGRKNTLVIVFSLQAVSYLIFAQTDTMRMLYISAVMFGFTAFSIPGIVAATCGDYVGSKLAPAALGMVTLFFGIGQALAPSVAGYLADSSHSFDSAFLIAAAISALGGMASLTLRNPAKADTGD